jgi:hypothetical protein
MLSLKSLHELTEVIENFSHGDIDRIIAIFGFSQRAIDERASKVTKSTDIFIELKVTGRTGPFGGDLKMELLQYVIDRYFKNNPMQWEDGDVAWGGKAGTIKFENAFSHSNSELANSLKRDGFIVEGKTIKKLLPEEIEEAQIESELEKLLKEFNFVQSKGHLNQAIENHSSSNWAGANSQFRTFFESLLIEIANHILPGNNPGSAPGAIKLMSATANPPFIFESLNEYNLNDKKASYLEGFWARLNPAGSHPGLSNEEDCTFRYHTTIVVARLLLARLKEYA